jgi:hypothetical protein
MCYDFTSPEFSYRPGVLPSESSATSSATNQPGGPPNRPLPPTPDDDTQGDRTLIMKRVSDSLNFYFFSFSFTLLIFALTPIDVSVICSQFRNKRNIY